MQVIDGPQANKSTVNISENEDLVAQTVEFGIDLATTLELAEASRERQRTQWLVDNQQAIDAYNRHVESNGAFSDGLRSF
ncbi:type II toxin-antitoxin system CcdA family antitoxin [Pseudomonas sp. LRF_L74]|uniref:type II toxin-antitoxin system CcdA family antitoxin n=1 Tax=Pseudomonas sp. LRF_L74 TaxID=3369422 RepID=UPI003F60770D